MRGWCPSLASGDPYHAHTLCPALLPPIQGRKADATLSIHAQRSPATRPDVLIPPRRLHTSSRPVPGRLRRGRPWPHPPRLD